MNVLVSACLLGIDCKYSGGNNASEKVKAFVRDKTVVCVCPEVMGGLPVPRIPCERRDGRIVNRNGEDCTEAFEKGVQMIMESIRDMPIDMVILQPRSPSCGRDVIYDGSFSGRLVPGSGILAEALQKRNIPIVLPEELPEPV